MTLVAKLDTGASCCIFQRKYGEELGFDIEKGMRQPLGTATGTFISYGHEVTVSVAGFQFDTIVFFAADVEINRNVLGRVGWLDRVVLGLVDLWRKALSEPLWRIAASVPSSRWTKFSLWPPLALIQRVDGTAWQTANIKPME